MQVLIGDTLSVHEDPGFLHALETMQYSFTSIASGLTSIAQPNVRIFCGFLVRTHIPAYACSLIQDAPQINNQIHCGIAYYVETLISRLDVMALVAIAVCVQAGIGVCGVCLYVFVREFIKWAYV